MTKPLHEMTDDEITQEIVDEVVAKARKTWDMMVRASGQTDIDYLTTCKEPGMLMFLHLYNRTKQAAKELGLNCPSLVEGLEIHVEGAEMPFELKIGDLS